MPSNTTINDFLGRPNPEIEQCRTTGGWNTSHRKWDPIEGIQQLQGFTYSNFYNTFKDDLKKPISSSMDIDLHKLVSRAHLNRVANEDSIALSVSTSILFPTNLALERVGTSFYIGAASLFSSAPDTGDADLGIGPYPKNSTSQIMTNYCPGDLKISSKWTSEGLLDPKLDIHNPGPQLRNQLRPLEQVQHYCRGFSMPWGFILTDEELTIVHISFCSTVPRLSNPTRGISHQRGPSDTSQLSSDMSNMSIDGSIYSGGSLGSSLGPIEICTIPWSASGDKKMTIKRALWYLARLAEKGDQISEWYPSLDPKASMSVPPKGLTLASKKVLPTSGSTSKPKGSESKNRRTIFIHGVGIASEVLEHNIALYFTAATFEEAERGDIKGFMISYQKEPPYFEDFLKYLRHDTTSWHTEGTERYVDSAAYRRRQQLKTEEL